MHTMNLLAHIILPVMHALTLLAHSLARHAHLDLASPHNLACHVHLDRSCTLWPRSSTCWSHPPWPCSPTALPVTHAVTLLVYCLWSHTPWPCSLTASPVTHAVTLLVYCLWSHTPWPCLPIALPVMHNSLFLFVVCLQPLKPMLLCLHIFYTHDQKKQQKTPPTKPPPPIPPHTHTKTICQQTYISEVINSFRKHDHCHKSNCRSTRLSKNCARVFHTKNIMSSLSLSPLSNCSLPQTWTKEERRQNCLDWPRGCKRSGLITTERVRWNAVPQHHRSSKALKSSKICKRKAKGINKQTCSTQLGRKWTATLTLHIQKSLCLPVCVNGMSWLGTWPPPPHPH